MAIYGYARVSTDGQSLASQEAELARAGCVKERLAAGEAQADVARSYAVSQATISRLAPGPFGGGASGVRV